MYQTVRRIYDILRRTIISFQFENTATRILVLELQDIIDIGSPERIDTLRIISDHADTSVYFAQALYNQMLGKIRILILVHQHKLKKAPVLLQYVRMIAEEYIRFATANRRNPSPPLAGNDSDTAYIFHAAKEL